MSFEVKVKAGFWINELIVGILLLLPCLLLYTFLYLGISNKGPFPDCQTQASSSFFNTGSIAFFGKQSQIKVGLT